MESNISARARAIGCSAQPRLDGSRSIHLGQRELCLSDISRSWCYYGDGRIVGAFDCVDFQTLVCPQLTSPCNPKDDKGSQVSETVITGEPRPPRAEELVAAVAAADVHTLQDSKRGRIAGPPRKTLKPQPPAGTELERLIGIGRGREGGGKILPRDAQVSEQENAVVSTVRSVGWDLAREIHQARDHIGQLLFTSQKDTVNEFKARTMTTNDIQAAMFTAGVRGNCRFAPRGSPVKARKQSGLTADAPTVDVPYFETTMLEENLSPSIVCQLTKTILYSFSLRIPIPRLEVEQGNNRVLEAHYAPGGEGEWRREASHLWVHSSLLISAARREVGDVPITGGFFLLGIHRACHFLPLQFCCQAKVCKAAANGADFHDGAST